jgi:hypothetical protein
MRSLMDDLGISMDVLLGSSIFVNFPPPCVDGTDFIDW